MCFTGVFFHQVHCDLYMYLYSENADLPEEELMTFGLLQHPAGT